jgi:subtilisin family serine protease
MMPATPPGELAAAIRDCVNAGARVLNLSLALAQPTGRAERELEDALDYAASRRTLVVAAAGNQGAVGSSAITRHPWVIPVIAYDNKGRPLGLSNLGGSIGKRGLGAPGDDVVSLAVSGKPHIASGTSAAAPFVTGTIALLWSKFPWAQANDVRRALIRASVLRRNTIVPPLLDAWAANRLLEQSRTQI